MGNETTTYSRDDQRSMNSNERPAYSRDYQRSMNFNERPAYSRDYQRSMNSNERPAYSRDDQRSMKSDETPTYSRFDQRSMKSDETPAYSKANDRLMKIENLVFDESYETKPFESEPVQNNYSGASPKPVRKCADCKKPPQMQCLHCSKHVCMECAQKHFALATEQIEITQHVLNDKMSIIDRLSAAAKERVNADRNKIIKQVDTERDQAFVQIDQLAEQQKKQIRNKSTHLSELSLDAIPSFIQHMTNEMDHINEANNHLFRVNTILPKIQVRQGPDLDKSF